MQILWATISGLIFGLGILSSGMSNPAKVINFFDLAGTWDPSLAFVMAGALAVTVPGYHFVLGWQRPLLDKRFHLPAQGRIDWRLIGGAALFGIGWGMAGFCPGGLVPVLGIGRLEPLVFAGGLLAGMVLARAWLAEGGRAGYQRA